MTARPRILLVSLRDPDDPMAGHERRCFADAAAVPETQVEVHAIQEGPLTADHLQGPDAVLFGGSGAYSVLGRSPWMPTALDALRRVLDARRPSWSSCFGFQAFALLLGGTVVHDATRTEMGGTQLRLTGAGVADPVTGQLPSTFWAQQGHQDHVIALPAGVVRLATGQPGIEQCFRVEGAPCYASQFHPELDARRVAERFRFYRDHYHRGDPASFDARIAELEASPDTPEMGHVLARLVRGGWR